MNVIVLLSGILFLLMAMIGGKKGIRSFVALFLNFIVIIMTLFFMSNPDLNPIIITLFACIFISLINLFILIKSTGRQKQHFIQQS